MITICASRGVWCNSVVHVHLCCLVQPVWVNLTSNAYQNPPEMRSPLCTKWIMESTKNIKPTSEEILIWNLDEIQSYLEIVPFPGDLHQFLGGISREISNFAYEALHGFHMFLMCTIETFCMRSHWQIYTMVRSFCCASKCSGRILNSKPAYQRDKKCRVKR